MPITNQSELDRTLNDIVDYFKSIGRGDRLDFKILTDFILEKTQNEFEKLRSLLNSDKWPEAVPQFLICSDTEEDKFERAEGIIDYLDIDLSGKTILDFGCGEGHFCSTASKNAKKVVGYDLQKTGNLNWELNEGYLLTTDFEKVKANATYDIVLLYDVLDHSDDPVEILNKIKQVCDTNSKVFVRCHSWMSRHGAHLYKEINKAWIHIFFTENELNSMGYSLGKHQKYFFPIDTQRNWFNQTGFKVVKEDLIRSDVEQIFRDDLFKNRIPKEFKDFPEWQMSQTFNDYTLTL